MSEMARQHHVIRLGDAHYPKLLKEISDPPSLLYALGDVELLNTPQLAMVGSRHGSPTGLQTAHDFAFHCAKAGLTITSGLALGVDGASHRGALDAGGKTIAVLGTGIDNIYPRRHQGLAAEIVASGGVVLSQFELGALPQPARFPQRNRVISGLSLGVLVVEAALRSGSLITARYAGEQGREVFTMPGSIHNPLAKGCHQLLKQGAKLVESVEDILEECQNFGVIFGQNKSKKNWGVAEGLDESHLDQQTARFLDCVGYEVSTVDSLIQRSGLEAAEVAAIISILEVQGLLESVPGGVCRVLVKEKNFV